MGPTTNEEYITLRQEEGVVVATILGGSFQDEKKILATLKRLGDVIDSHKKVRLVLDMASVEYLSSAGLGRLVALLKKTLAGGGIMHLAGVRAEIHELFEVMRLTQIFRLYPDVEQAKRALLDTAT